MTTTLKRNLILFGTGTLLGGAGVLAIQRKRNTPPPPPPPKDTDNPQGYLQHDEKKSISTKAVDLSASLVQSFQPIKQIHQHLAGVHMYDGCVNRQLVAHHYCTCVNDEMHQCVIYDSDKPNARLIGIEYVISARLFEQLPQEEKRYWHSHKYEVESGLLRAPGVPSVMEKRVMGNLATTYGKTWHAWQVDRDSMPLGDPQLMMALMTDGQLSGDVQKLLEEQTKMSVAVLRKERDHLRTPEPSHDADQWFYKTNKQQDDDVKTFAEEPTKPDKQDKDVKTNGEEPTKPNKQNVKTKPK